MLRGRAVTWAVPTEHVVGIREFHDGVDSGILDGSNALALDPEARPRRVVEIRSSSREIAVLVFGRAEVLSADTENIFDLPELLRIDPAGQWVRGVIARDGVAVAWVLEVEMLEETGTQA